MFNSESLEFPGGVDFMPTSKSYLHERDKSLVGRIFPGGFKNELKNIMAIFFPIVLTSFFRFLNPMISLIMCGHLSRVEFDAASLANSLINIFGVSIDLGFSTAFDTLFAQIYGSDQKMKMGALLQRAVIVMTVIYIALTCFHMNIEPVLILLKQDPFVSELAARYIILYLPGLFFDFQFLTFSRYLQNQNIVYPMMISSFLGNVFSAISQYVAIYIYGYKLEASAILQASACFVMFALQLGYILISKVYKDTWKGFSLRDALDNWKLLFAIGIPGILMIGLEEWNFETATIISGTISGVQLGAQSIAFQCATVSFMITMGLSISTGIRVGQFLGRREIDSLKTSYRTVFVIGMISSTTVSILVFSLRSYISHLLSSDEEIQTAGSNLLIYIAFMQFPDVIAGILNGIMKACGRQFVGACIMFACYYFVGIPLGLLLVFKFHFNIEGMWIGLISALSIECILFSVFIYRINWETECDRAMENMEELETDNSNFQKVNEDSPLIVKSDCEGDAHWVREKIFNPNIKIKHIKNKKSIDVLTMPTNRCRSMIMLQSRELLIDTEDPLKKTILIRLLTVTVVLIFFICSLMVRIYLPRSAYLPCIKNTTEAFIYYKNDPEYLCISNSTTY